MLSLCVICIGCSAQSDNEKKGAEGKTSASDSSEATTLERATGKDGEIDVIEIEPENPDKDTDKNGNKTTTANDGKDKKQTTTKKSGNNDGKSNDKETTTSESIETPIIPIP